MTYRGQGRLSQCGLGSFDSGKYTTLIDDCVLTEIIIGSELMVRITTNDAATGDISYHWRRSVVTKTIDSGSVDSRSVHVQYFSKSGVPSDEADLVLRENTKGDGSSSADGFCWFELRNRSKHDQERRSAAIAARSEFGARNERVRLGTDPNGHCGFEGYARQVAHNRGEVLGAGYLPHTRIAEARTRTAAALRAQKHKLSGASKQFLKDSENPSSKLASTPSSFTARAKIITSCDSTKPCSQDSGAWFGGEYSSDCIAISLNDKIDVVVMMEGYRTASVFGKDGTISDVQIEDLNPDEDALVLDHVWGGSHFEVYVPACSISKNQSNKTEGSESASEVSSSEDSDAMSPSSSSDESDDSLFANKKARETRGNGKSAHGQRSKRKRDARHVKNDKEYANVMKKVCLALDRVSSEESPRKDADIATLRVDVDTLRSEVSEIRKLLQSLLTKLDGAGL